MTTSLPSFFTAMPWPGKERASSPFLPLTFRVEPVMVTVTPWGTWMTSWVSGLTIRFTSVHVGEKLAARADLLGAVVADDAARRGHDERAKVLRGEIAGFPLLEVGLLDGVARLDDAAVVDVAVQLDAEAATRGVIDELEGTDVAGLLHDLEDVANQLGRGANLAFQLARLLGVLDEGERIGERIVEHLSHLRSTS